MHAERNELIATDAGDDIGITIGCGERARNDPQGVVAGRVVERIVDRLEGIDSSARFRCERS